MYQTRDGLWQGALADVMSRKYIWWFQRIKMGAGARFDGSQGSGAKRCAIQEFLALAYSLRCRSLCLYCLVHACSLYQTRDGLWQRALADVMSWKYIWWFERNERVC